MPARGRRDRVRHPMAKWAAALANWTPTRLASLYSRHALFFGSNPKLYRGLGRRHLPTSRDCRGGGRPPVQFSRLSWPEQASAPDLVNVVATASFDADEGAVKFVGQDHPGDRPRRRRLEDRQPSRVVEGAVDLTLHRSRAHSGLRQSTYSSSPRLAENEVVAQSLAFQNHSGRPGADVPPHQTGRAAQPALDMNLPRSRVARARKRPRRHCPARGGGSRTRTPAMACVADAFRPLQHLSSAPSRRS